ncbi:universal stress protein [Rhizobium bangladeshense]|uniref:universal stress protein n=2 Tax=Rhizobium bangladeshense TaxID=1138189 RepID=UPI002180A904|nr:universal stress protein [Rhizobium bangladeshense]
MPRWKRPDVRASSSHDMVLSTRAIGLGDREAGTPAETILGLAKSLDVEVIVMGAYGHHGNRETFGSTTREVLNASPTLFFLHH